jgi:outer membrane protein TolC
MLLIFLTIAWGADSLTLEQAVTRALQDNLELASQRHENAIAKLQLDEARAVFDPRLSASARTGGSSTPTNMVNDGGDVVTSTSNAWSTNISAALPTGGMASVGLNEFTSASDSANAAAAQYTSDSLTVSASQPLLRGAFFGQLTTLRDAHLGVLEQELVWRGQVEQLTMSVSDTYWGLVAARQGHELATRSVQLAERQLTETEERKAAGFAGSGDVLQVQVAVGQARRVLVNADANLHASESALARILGMPLDQGALLQLVDMPAIPDVTPPRDKVLDSALTQNAGYLLSGLQHERSARNVKRAKNAALPDLSVDGSAGWSSGRQTASTSRSDLVAAPSPSWGVGVSVGLPLFMRDTKAQYDMAKLRKEQAELALKAAEQDLILEVDGAMRTVTRDRASLDVALQTLAHAQLSLEAQRELLSEGRGSTRDVVDALESLRAAEVSKLQAEIACQGSLMRALQVSGGLLTIDR